ncbi:MAG: diacylglycerol kinase family lipid kinase [Anaerolineae bacterium]|nr:diacylglycerol kinase family lipid kinase [Anaerolineae bacterium]
MKNNIVIVNPVSGNGAGKRLLPAITEKLNGIDLDYDLEVTMKPGHAKDLAFTAIKNGYQKIIAAGGDGTVNEVINGMMLAGNGNNANVPLAVICIGRGNDFSYGVGIPTNWLNGIEVIKTGRQQMIDLAYLKGGDFPGGRYVGNGIGIGFDAVVSFVAARNKILTGFSSYAWAALKTIYLYYQAPSLKIELDDETILLSGLMVSIMNGRRMGGGFHMAPDSQPDDGLFDLCIVNEIPKGHMIPLIMRFMRGIQGGHKAVQFKRSKSVKVTAIKGTIPAHADGEAICTAGKEIDIQIVPNAINVMVPREA